MKSLKYNGHWAVDTHVSDALACLDPDDVIVDIAVCGICGTDVGIISGAYPAAVTGVTLGHEAAGVVSQIGRGVTQFQLGDRVVINPTYFCGTCRMCQTGNANHCERKMGTEAGVSYDGAFAHQYRAKENFLIKLDHQVSMAAAALTEPLSCVIAGVDKLAITQRTLRATVLGAGPMGLLYLWVLHTLGVRAFLIEKNPSRQDFARKNLPSGAALYETFEDCLEQEYGARDAQIDLAVDTTGQLAETVFEHLAPGGKLLNIALKDKKATFDLLKIADRSLSIIGSIDSLNQSFERAYRMIRDQNIPAENLVSHIFDFEEYRSAFRTIGCDIEKKKLVPPVTPNGKVMLRLSTLV